MRTIFGLIFVFGGITLAIWLGFVVMLYGGIMAAVNNFSTDNSAVVWGIIRAVFFMAGIALGAIFIKIGVDWLE